ncbi:FadD16 [Mycolicibacterium rhodesiae JS60]|nr:FadD16 [Mycolicibacterium rhodesiae JS60]
MPDARPPHSLVLAADYHVPDLARLMAHIEENAAHLAPIGAHHIVTYSSIWESDRILVTIGLRHHDSIADLMRSEALFGWFDEAGVEDFPAIFLGEVLEKVDLRPEGSGSRAPGVVVAAFASIRDIARLRDNVHRELGTFAAAGCRQIWMYQALDGCSEVLILQEVDDEATARRWIDRSDVSAEWMRGAGFGAYPTVFVGRLEQVVKVAPTPRMR